MMNKGSFKSLFSFEFWQKFGKALMVVIAVMPVTFTSCLHSLSVVAGPKSVLGVPLRLVSLSS